MTDGTRSRLLAVAGEIGDALCRAAWWHRDRCAWLGTVQEADEDDAAYRFAHVTLGASLYGGGSGVALFLGELAPLTGSAAARDTAAGGMCHALDAAEREPPGPGYYAGTLGTAHAAARLAHCLERPDLFARAGALVDRWLAAEDGPGRDMISGAAGAIVALLALADRMERPVLRERAARLGEALLGMATRTEAGLAWTSERFPLGLTGFAHGAAGIGWALAELYAATGAVRFAEGAREAGREEDRWFRADLDNWADFREHEGDPAEARCALAWCHGAPGIGLARLRSSTLLRDEALRRDAEAAVRATRRRLLDEDGMHADASLCHGWTGLAEFLAQVAAALGNGDLREEVVELALARADAHAGDPSSWRCGLTRGSTPALMLGLAGIGYFYLRLAEPGVPSVLLPWPEVGPAPGVGAGQAPPAR
jgi:lantibiotic biosynthesis protein